MQVPLGDIILAGRFIRKMKVFHALWRYFRNLSVLPPCQGFPFNILIYKIVTKKYTKMIQSNLTVYKKNVNIYIGGQS